MKKIRSIVAALIGVGLLFTLTACPGDTSAQSQAQSVTDQYQQAARQAVPYPLDAMRSGGWSERTLLREHLLRQNDPNGLRWVTLLSQQMQVIATWPIKGMVFDPNSSLTNSQSVSCGSSSGSCTTVSSPGDNGTWGPEAGAAAFFTTSGVEVQLPHGAIWIESDAPLNITDKPLITYNVDARPSVNHDGLKGIGGK